MASRSGLSGWAWLILLLGLAGPAVAEQEIRFSRLSMAEGLAQSSIADFTQCPDGYIWFATQHGLDRFDGWELLNFAHDPLNPDSLSNDRVLAVETGRDGQLWVLHPRGLDRFDPRSRRAQRFQLADSPLWPRQRVTGQIIAEHADGRLFVSLQGQLALWHPADPSLHALPFAPAILPEQAALRSEVLDSAGRFWAFNAAGLWRLDEAEPILRLVLPLPHQPSAQPYSTLALTAEGHLAVITDQQFKLIDADSLTVLEQWTVDDLGVPTERLDAVLASSDGAIWLLTPRRLLRYHRQSRTIEVLYTGIESGPAAMLRQRVRMVEHPNGDLWFASQFGLIHVDARSDRPRRLVHDPADPFSIPQSLPQLGVALMIDDEGNVWLGTHLGGAAWHAPARARFEHIVDRSSPVDSPLPFAGQNVIRGIAELLQGEVLELWLALDHAGIRRLRRAADGRFQWQQSFHTGAAAPERLPEDAIWSLAVDPLTARVWALGTDFLTLIDPASQRVLRAIPLAEFGLPPGAGRRLLISRDGQVMWLGSRSGVRELGFGEDRSQPQLRPVQPAGPAFIVFGLLESSDGGLLAIGGRTVAKFRAGAAEAEWQLHEEQMYLPERADLHALAAHPDGGWWIGGRGGLGHLQLAWHPDGRPDVRLDWLAPDTGLNDETVYALLTEPAGPVWISTNRGLMRWDHRLGKLRQFTPADGVQALEFNNSVALLGHDGAFYFGGINGINRFHPERFSTLLAPPRVLLRELRVNGQKAALPADPAQPLRLRHHQNDLEIIFSGLSLADPQRVRHAFRLEGVDTDWVDGGAIRQTRYASLAPGTYRFHLRAANSDGVWSEPQLLLSAVVAPPPWFSPIAFSIYTVLLMLVAMLTYGEQLRRQRALEAEVAARTAELRDERALVERQAQELAESLAARTVLLANVSHEFRTPLTLIKTSLDRLATPAADAEAVALGRRYLRRLLKLVDQLLDFSRLGHEQGTAERNPWALEEMVRMTLDAFRGVAEERGIELTAAIETGWHTRCLQAQVEKILLNLLTNAIKFTPPGGQVQVSVRGEDGGVCLSVADTGPGIPAAEQEHIFERFYRVPAVESAEIAGAGIGLSLVREAVRANGGRITVHSQAGEGACFSVWLPAWIDSSVETPLSLLSQREYRLDIETLRLPAAIEPAVPLPAPEARPTVLVVEDNPDLRRHLVAVLGRHWAVLEAGDGHLGLCLARSHAPDVIVSDIMMPGLDGLALLEALRSDVGTSHIPVLMLSARQDQATRVQAFTLNADGFLAKPFDDGELLARLQAMLAIRRHLRERLRREMSGLALSESPRSALPEISERDHALLERVRAWIEAHHADPELKVADMAQAAWVDLRTLQRKLRSLLDLTPAGLLQEVRLEKARAMLRARPVPIQLIAASCGFGSPQAFSRIFRQVEGLAPNQWRRVHAQSTRH